MNALTIDLIATLLASCGVLACGAFAVWILPWRARDWQPQARSARRRFEPRIMRDLVTMP